MTDKVALQRYDFSQPTGLNSDLNDRWTVWMESVRNLFKERWSRFAEEDVDFRAGKNMMLSFNAARARLPQHSAAFYTTIGNPPIQTMMVMERPTALGLVLLSLGAELTQRPEDREITGVEASVLELLMGQIVQILGESWPRKDPLPCKLGAFEPLAHRSRMLAPGKVVLLVHLNVTIAQQNDVLSWIIPHAELENLLSVTDDPDSSPIDKRKMERRAHDIPVQVAVNLGQVNLTMSELSSLERGDLIVLKQKISEPLPVVVSGQLKFMAWPGRKGNRGAIKISQVI